MALHVLDVAKLQIKMAAFAYVAQGIENTVDLIGREHHAYKSMEDLVATSLRAVQLLKV